MQTQASLREAETSKIMNLVVLPFTVVTVIFVRPYGAYTTPSDSAMLMNITWFKIDTSLLLHKSLRCQLFGVPT